jgi:hypothetical protein
MKNSWPIFALLAMFTVVWPVHSEEPKELKITAHRLHIPAEQLKNARQALREATDLFMNSTQYHYTQTLYMSWQQLNPSKAGETAEEFIRKFRSEAMAAIDVKTYQEATIYAVSLVKRISDSDFEKIQQFIRSWPVPAPGIAVPPDFLKKMESEARENTQWKLAISDPQQALTLLFDDSKKYDYRFSWQIAQGLMNAGKKEDADQVIDRSIRNFIENAKDEESIQGYRNFLWSAGRELDDKHATAAINALINKIASQKEGIDCSGKLTVSESSIDLTCTESEALDIIHRFSNRPELLVRTLDSFPSLKSKLAASGGIDSTYRNKSELKIIRNGSTEKRFGRGDPEVPENSEKLLKELSGQVKSNPGYVKRRLKDAAKKSGIEILTRMAWTNPFRNDITGGAELAGMALEIARQLNNEDKLHEEFSLIQAYQQLEGTVDRELFKNAFLFVEQMKKEESKPKPAGQIEIRMGPCSPFTGAECLESRLVHELAKDSFEEAMAHARSVENNDLKFECLLTVSLALSKPNF